MNNFWNGFEKNAWHRLGVNKDIIIVGGAKESERKVGKRMQELVFHQNWPKAILSLIGKLEGPEFAKSMKHKMKNRMYDAGTVGGTVASGKKGTRVYINRAMARDPSNGLNLREILNHETFHAKAPFGLRHSEILAHAWGGLKSRKNKLDLIKAIKSTGHAFATRPVRAGGELALGAGALYAGVKGLKKGIDKIKNLSASKPGHKE